MASGRNSKRSPLRPKLVFDMVMGPRTPRATCIRGEFQIDLGLLSSAKRVRETARRFVRRAGGSVAGVSPCR